MIRNNKGFSLVELMVVVAIIGILSAIAIPQINKYMARARQTEAKTNLSSVYTANKAFYAEYNIYDNHFDVIGYRPEGKLRYNLGWADETGKCDLSQYNYTGNPAGATNAKTQCQATTLGADGTLSGGNCYLLKDGDQAITGSALDCTQSFTAAAAGKIATTTSIDRWAIDEKKVLRNSNDGTQ